MLFHARRTRRAPALSLPVIDARPAVHRARPKILRPAHASLPFARALLTRKESRAPPRPPARSPAAARTRQSLRAPTPRAPPGSELPTPPDPWTPPPRRAREEFTRVSRIMESSRQLEKIISMRMSEGGLRLFWRLRENRTL